MRRSGFTLIEVMVAMTVLLLLVMGMTRMFSQASSITKQGMTSISRNSVAETAMETILQDVDGLIVNERLGCYVEADTVDTGGFGFDEAWFVSTSGDQDDDMPYEYFHYYVKQVTASNALGAVYKRFDLHKERWVMAAGDHHGIYALEKDQTDWWNVLKNFSGEDDQVLAEDVVQFDIYCMGWGGDGWMDKKNVKGHNYYDGSDLHYAGSTLGDVKNVPPATFDIVLVVTSPDAAMEGGMGIEAGGDLALKGRALMLKEAATYIGRAVPMTGVSQLHHPDDHYLD